MVLSVVLARLDSAIGKGSSVMALSLLMPVSVKIEKKRYSRVENEKKLELFETVHGNFWLNTYKFYRSNYCLLGDCSIGLDPTVSHAATHSRHTLRSSQ